MKQSLTRWVLGMTLMASAAAAVADDRFNIVRFQVDGNSVLPADEVQRLVAPYVGSQRDYGDVQKALEALEGAYRKLGYNTIQVYVPEQELTAGVVTIKVTESRIGNISVSGNQHFSEKNIRASLPQLKSGKIPNLRKISEAVQLSNDNPAKQVNVTLNSDDSAPGTVDADIKVSDNNPWRVILSLDNTGSATTGNWRTGVALQHANLFGRDQVGTLAYTTSPDSPHGVSVNLYSIGYRIPLYSIGDSIDVIYGKSTVNAPGSTAAVGNQLGFVGKGDIYGLRWNHFFAREGETSTKLVFGVDYKKIGASCDFGGVQLSLGTCSPYTVVPLSATYSGQQRSARRNIDYSIGVSRNWATGPTYQAADGHTDHYSFVSPGGRNTTDDFVVLRGGASIFQGLESDWQWRLAGTLQYAKDPLVAAEQISLAGASAVRGFTERAVAADSGVVINAELYTPELAKQGNLRLLAFFDIGHGRNNNNNAGTNLSTNVTVSSVGFGARYVLGRDFSLKLDVARVLARGDSNTEKHGDLNAHVSATLGF